MLFRSLFVIIFLFAEVNILAGPQATVKIDIPSAQEFLPIDGLLSINREASLQVDTNDIKVGDQALTVVLVEEKSTDNNKTITSVYQFQLPVQSRGLHVLPEVQVKIGGKQYTSIPTTYEVHATTQDIFIKLDTIYQGPKKLFPGLRAIIGYRIYYRGMIELTKEVLPLLEANGFLKISNPEFNDHEENGVKIQEITQQVRAIKAGSHEFPASIIEGIGSQGQNQIAVKAEVPAMSLMVDDFPKKGKPPAFNGAIGKFSWQVSMQTPSQLSVGDKIGLIAEVIGDGEWATVALPHISCQPGFSGFFQFNDLPSSGDLKGSSKTFDIELRPLVFGITEIPPISFAFFDADKEIYHEEKSDPILINIDPPKENIESTKQLLKPIAANDTQWQKQLLKPKEVQFKVHPGIESNMLDPDPLQVTNVLIFLGLGVLLLEAQIAWLHWRKKNRNNNH